LGLFLIFRQLFDLGLLLLGDYLCSFLLICGDNLRGLNSALVGNLVFLFVKFLKQTRQCNLTFHKYLCNVALVTKSFKIYFNHRYILPIDAVFHNPPCKTSRQGGTYDDQRIAVLQKPVHSPQSVVVLTVRLIKEHTVRLHNLSANTTQGNMVLSIFNFLKRRTFVKHS